MSRNTRRKHVPLARRAAQAPVSKQVVHQMMESKFATYLEPKYLIPFLATATSSATPIVTGLTDIPEGDGDTARTGDKISLIRKPQAGTPGSGFLNLRYYISVDLGSDATQQLAMVRVIVFQWHPQSESGGSTEPSSLQVLGTATPNMNSFYSHDNRQQYTILFDKVHVLVGPGTAATNAYNPAVLQFHEAKISLSKAQAWMQYSAASSVIATNHLYILTYSNLAADPQNPSLTWAGKFFFIDP